jgi:hypothetical protein
MTANQTLGFVASASNLPKIQAEVRSVENERRFAALKQVITDIVAQGKPGGVPEDQIRDNAIVLAMNINLEFRLAVSQRLFAAYQAGSLK